MCPTLDDLVLSRSLRSRGGCWCWWCGDAVRDDRGNNPSPLMNGNCCALGTGPIDAVGCGVLLFPIAVDAACDKFWACACAAAARFETTAAAARYSSKHVAGVRSRKSHGCSSDCGDNCSSFDLRPERKAKMRVESYFLCIMSSSSSLSIFFSSLQLLSATITLFFYNNNDHRENCIKLFSFDFLFFFWLFWGGSVKEKNMNVKIMRKRHVRCLKKKKIS